MAKRYGSKKGKREGHHKRAGAGHHYKSLRRVKAGRKAWLTRVRRYGSKAAALAASFGRRGHKVARRAHHRDANRMRRLARNPARVLAAIQAREGTTGLPPTPAEMRLVRIVVARSGRVPEAGMTAEERHRAAFKADVARKMHAEAARRANLARQHRAAEEHAAARAREEAEAKAAIEAELRAL